MKTNNDLMLEHFSRLTKKHLLFLGDLTSRYYVDMETGEFLPDVSIEDKWEVYGYLCNNIFLGRKRIYKHMKFETNLKQIQDESI